MNTRQQIIDATERIIQAKGIARATTKEIAREAGYAEGTLYKHFESKEDLFLSALQQHLPSFIEALGESVAGQGTLRSNLEQIAQAAIVYYDRLIPLATAFFADADLLARYRQALAQAQAGPQRTHERVACYIEEEQRLGRIDKGQDPFYIAALLLGSCFQYAFIRHFVGTQPFSMTDRQFVAGAVQALLTGITPCQG